MFQAIAVLTILAILWRIAKSTLAFRNITGPPSGSFLTGNLEQLYGIKAWSFHDYIEKNFGKVVRIHGALGDVQLLIYDPKALHSIVVKEQDNYEETPFFIELNRVLFGGGIFAQVADQHRKQRKLLNPILSAAHLKEMIPIFYQIVFKVRDAIKKQVKNDTQEVEILQWMTRTALELIGQTGLGHSFDPLLDESYSHPYSDSLKDLLHTVQGMTLLPYLLPYLVKIGPAGFRKWVVDLADYWIPWKNLRNLKSMTDIINNTSKEVLKTKKQAMNEGEEAMSHLVGEGKDFITHLLRANKEASAKDKLPESEIEAQMAALMFAAMDTTSGFLARVLQLLAENPDMQDKLRAELLAARGREDDELTYEQLMTLPLLDAICRETLRLYPPVSILSRTTRKDAVLPLSAPLVGRDGQKITEIPIPKDTNIMIGILGINRDPSIWGEDAHEWKPQRWLQPLPESVKVARIPGVYSNMLTFLGGGRSCIGFQFAQLEMKVVLSVLLPSFSFALEREIAWDLSANSVPRMKDEGYAKMMYMKLSLMPYN